MKTFLLSLCLIFGTIAHADPVTNYMGKMIWTQQAVIAINTNTSQAIDLAGYQLVGIKFPAAMTGTTVTFVMCDTLGGTYLPVYNSSGQVSYTIAASRYYAIAPADIDGARYIKVVSGSMEAAQRIMVLSLKGR